MSHRNVLNTYNFQLYLKLVKKKCYIKFKLQSHSLKVTYFLTFSAVGKKRTKNSNFGNNSFPVLGKLSLVEEITNLKNLYGKAI